MGSVHDRGVPAKGPACGLLWLQFLRKSLPVPLSNHGALLAAVYNLVEAISAQMKINNHHVVLAAVANLTADGEILLDIEEVHLLAAAVTDSVWNIQWRLRRSALSGSGWLVIWVRILRRTFRLVRVSITR